ncbi:MAG: IS1634 family transposase [Trebonia sp.]
MRAVYGPASAGQPLGALPAAAAFCRRLDIAGIIDRAAPCREAARAAHGQVIEALIASRLTSPSPMVHVAARARQFAVGPVPGLAAGVLNDDRIGRALDALAEVAEEVTGPAGAAAIAEFGTEVSQVHWDMTSVSLHGDYRHCDEGYPQPRYGHPKDRRTGLKQVQAGIAASAGGAVPLFFRPHDGGAGEVNQVTGAMEALRRLAGPRRFLLVGDSRLLSYADIAALTEAKADFLGPAPKSLVPASVLAGCDYGAAEPAGFTAARDAARPEDRRGSYRVAEDAMTLAGPRKKDPAYAVRRVLAHSSARAQGAAAARDKKLARAAAGLGRLRRGLGSRHYKTTGLVTARISAIARGRHVSDYLRASVTTGPPGKPVLDWHFDEDAITAEAATDGWYALLTSLPPDVTAARVLERCKNQPAVSERRYHDLKGPLGLAPMFLHRNKRIAAIIAVICLALLVYCLAEREARRNLAPAQAIDGLYAGRPARPTASLIFNALATLRLRAPAGGPPEIPQPDPLQLKLLDLLKIDPRQMVDYS